MKKHFLLICISFSALFAVAQTNGELAEYRRNSLATMMIYHSEDQFGDSIYRAFESMPIPDKYDDHSFGFNVILNDSIRGVQRNQSGLIKAQLGKNLTRQDIEQNGRALEALLNDAQCAKLLVARWFGLNISGGDEALFEGFNMRLIQERGQYNASDIDVETALLTPRGVATLSDAGEELINNTFILVNDITYVTAEEKAAVAKTVMNVLGGLLDAFLGGSTGSDLASMGGAIADSFTGFTVKTHSYLFQLVWNDSIANTFYNDYYTDLPHVDSAKIMAFLQDDSLFRLRYVAHEYEYDAKSVLKGEYSREELIKTVCTKSMDKNIAALQLAYEDFKVKTPVYEVVTDNRGRATGYTAKVGMKEGITETSKFQVIERVIDPATNRTSYRHVASLKPVRGKIWDNRYNAVTEGDPGSELSATLFKKTTGSEIVPGMLIIEGKYRKVTK